jgi:hypothetical protein
MAAAAASLQPGATEKTLLANGARNMPNLKRPPESALLAIVVVGEPTDGVETPLVLE